MTTLIERLEEVEAGSRELDAEIAALVGVPHGPFEDVDIEARRIERWDEIAPVYTTLPYDLTAAIGLVPEGWRIIRVEFSASGHRTYMHLGKIGTLDTVLGIGSSLSLALTAAALRAKEIEDEQRSTGELP